MWPSHIDRDATRLEELEKEHRKHSLAGPIIVASVSGTVGLYGSLLGVIALLGSKAESCRASEGTGCSNTGLGLLAIGGLGIGGLVASLIWLSGNRRVRNSIADELKALRIGAEGAQLEFEPTPTGARVRVTF